MRKQLLDFSFVLIASGLLADDKAARLKLVSAKIAAFEKEHTYVLAAGSITTVKHNVNNAGFSLIIVQGTTTECRQSDKGCGVNGKFLVGPMPGTFVEGKSYSGRVWFAYEVQGNILFSTQPSNGTGEVDKAIIELYAERELLGGEKDPTGTVTDARASGLLAKLQNSPSLAAKAAPPGQENDLFVSLQPTEKLGGKEITIHGRIIDVTRLNDSRVGFTIRLEVCGPLDTCEISILTKADDENTLRLYERKHVLLNAVVKGCGSREAPVLCLTAVEFR